MLNLDRAYIYRPIHDALVVKLFLRENNIDCYVKKHYFHIFKP